MGQTITRSHTWNTNSRDPQMALCYFQTDRYPHGVSMSHGNLIEASARFRF